MVCLVEKDAPPIYQLKPDETSDGVFELDDDLVHSVVLDDLYTKGTRRRQIKLPYRRKGRNIEVLVREPYHVREFDGINFHAVTFKGAGAIPLDSKSKLQIIDPLTGRGGTQILQHKRIWGGLDEGFAVGEAEEKILSSRGIFHTPYIAQNQIPEIVQEEIYREASPIKIYSTLNPEKPQVREKQDSDPDLYQIVRLSMTNIRHSDFNEFDTDQLKNFAQLSLRAGWTLEKWVEHLSTVNGKLVKEGLKLARKGKFLQFVPLSEFDENTYITGEITDLEQVTLEDCVWQDSWASKMMEQSINVLQNLSKELKEDFNSVLSSYIKKISKISGYTFSSAYSMDYAVYSDMQLKKYLKRKNKMEEVRV